MADIRFIDILWSAACRCACAVEQADSKVYWLLLGNFDLTNVFLLMKTNIFQGEVINILA